MKKELASAIKLLASGYKRVDVTIKIDSKEYEAVCYEIPGVGGSIIRIDLKEVKK